MRHSATGEKLTTRDLVIAMLDIYGAKFLDPQSRDLAIESWVHLFKSTPSETAMPNCDAIRDAVQHAAGFNGIDDPIGLAFRLAPQVVEHLRSTPSATRANEHVKTDRCGFDRNSSINEDRYVCDCGWREEGTMPVLSEHADDKSARALHLNNVAGISAHLRDKGYAILADQLDRAYVFFRDTPSATRRNEIIEEIAGQTKVQHIAGGWCLTDEQIRALKTPEYVSPPVRKVCNCSAFPFPHDKNAACKGDDDIHSQRKS